MDVISVDIGGTSIKVGRFGRDGCLKSDHTVLFDAKQGGKALLRKVIEIIGSESEYDAIGVSSAGQIDVGTGRIIYATDNIPGYTGMPVKDMLAERFHVPVTVENDVNCAAIGEAYFGSGRGYPDFLCLTFGTGIGGAIVLNGRIYRGSTGSAAEFGHIVTHAGGTPCTCGNRGCYEAYASTSALLKMGEQATGLADMDGKTLFSLLEHGNTALKGVVDLWIDEIVIGLTGLVYVFNPKLVLLGGGVMNEAYITGQVEERLIRSLMPSFQNLAIQKTALGNKAGIYGAYYLASGR